LAPGVSTVRYPIPQRTFKYVATVQSVTDERCQFRTFHALGTVYYRWIGNAYPPLELNGWQNLFGACLLLPFAAEAGDCLRPPGVWKRSQVRTSEAPPDERGGNRYVRATATAPHLDSANPENIYSLRVLPPVTHLRHRARSGLRPVGCHFLLAARSQSARL
jgi:hypothetical protein